MCLPEDVRAFFDCFVTLRKLLSEQPTSLNYSEIHTHISGLNYAEGD